MIKVVYDVAYLGDQYKSSAGRAGLFRVTEEVACQLMNSKECDTKFCVSTTFSGVDGASDYFKNEKGFEKVPLIVSPFRYYLGKSPLMMRQFWGQLVARIGKFFNFSKDRKPNKFFKIIRTFFDEIFKALRIEELFFKILKVIKDFLRKKGYVCPIPVKRLYHAQIYHSPWSPIPEHIRTVAGLQKIITIHDLVPVIYTFFFTEENRSYFNKILKSIRPDDWVICVSQSTKEDLCRFVKIDPARVFVVYSAANKKIFYRSPDRKKNVQVRQKYGIPDKPYLMCLNTLEPRKNTELVIQAFSGISHLLNDAILVLVGDKGWMYEGIFEELSKSGLSGKIFVTGYVADADLSAFYSDTVCFIYPSFYEGFGLPVLEAMQCGAPVITSDTSSLPEITGEAGIMVSPVDQEALCEAILSLVNNESLRKELSLKSLARAAEFTWERNARQLVEVYKIVSLHPS